MTNFCILRTAKLKTVGNISASGSHTYREVFTPNADPSRTHLNEHFGAQNKDELVNAYRDRLSEIGTIRKNAVLGLEYFIGASPEFFKESDKEEHQKFFDNAKKWLEEKHGKENIMYIGTQVDETTPHMVAYVVPVDIRGKLNASAFIDGRKMLSDMQTDFAEKVGKPSKLERGLEGSTASHTKISHFYGAINSETPEVKTQIPAVQERTVLEAGLEAIGLKTEHSRQVEIADKARKLRNKEKIERQEIIVQKAKFSEIAKRSTDEKALQLAALRETASEVRKIPLEDVLTKLGCTRDPADKKNWKTPAGRITITGDKFFNHDLQAGGGGAIDIVMQVEGYNYKDAVSFLGGQASKSAVMGAVVEKAKQEALATLEGPKKRLEPPAPEPSKWPKVREYLVGLRAIKESLVDALHDAGRLYADRFANAVFLSRDKKSCQLRGTGDTPFHGMRGPNKDWIFTHPETEKTKKIICVESAIDGLSYAEIHGFEKGDTLFSFGGSSGDSLRKMAEDAKKNGVKVIGAFDRDTEGERMAEVLKRTGVDYERKTPMKKDWNADLQEMKGIEMPEVKKKKIKGMDLGR